MAESDADPTSEDEIDAIVQRETAKGFDSRPFNSAKVHERRRAQEAAKAPAPAPVATKEIIGPPSRDTISVGGPGPEREVVLPDDDEDAPVVRAKPKFDISGTLEDVLNQTPPVVGVFFDGSCPNGTALLRYLTLIGRTGERVNPENAGELLVRLNRKLVVGLIELLKAKVPDGLEPVTTGRHIGADQYRPCFKPDEFDFTEIPTGSMTIRPLSRDGHVGALDMRRKDTVPA